MFLFLYYHRGDSGCRDDHAGGYRDDSRGVVLFLRLLPAVSGHRVGDGLRVGLEDNVMYGKDADGNKIIATNLMLVERAVELAKLAGREIATADDAREILGITRNCLRDEAPVVDVDPAIAHDAVKPIERMLELS